jgi:hypothetical protein
VQRWSMRTRTVIGGAQPYRQVTGSAGTGVSRSMCVIEKMIDRHGLTSECTKCTRGSGTHSIACSQGFDMITSDILDERLKASGMGSGEAAGSAAPPGAAPPAITAATTAAASSPSSASTASGTQVAGSTAPDARDLSKRLAPLEDTPRETAESISIEPGNSKKARVASVGERVVRELAVCEEEADGESDPIWDPVTNASKRCIGQGLEHDQKRCKRKEDRGDRECRRCWVLVTSMTTEREQTAYPRHPRSRSCDIPGCNQVGRWRCPDCGHMKCDDHGPPIYRCWCEFSDNGISEAFWRDDLLTLVASAMA